MKYTQFQVLNMLQQHPDDESRKPSQRELAAACGCSLGAVNNAIKALRTAGYVDGKGRITDAGIEALEPYRVQNALIMAAGLSTRFAPISYEHPKGTFKVKGEVLIERQIGQLKEAGIDDIIVVVGYKKAEFFYLEDKFGVKIVVNGDFATRNNNSTIKKVAHLLGNTYICSSDNYFTENPFERYVYDSYYSSVYHEGYIDEYCLETKGRDDLIVGAQFGGSDAWITLGHAYWDRAFARTFTEILDSVYDDPKTAGKLWETIYFEHVERLPMRIRRYEPGIIWEFDSLDEVRAFDPHFIESVDSKILDNICATLRCERADVGSFEPINQGLTNLSVMFEAAGVPYVYRHPGAGTDAILSRESEAFSQGVARDLGVDRTFVFEDPQVGWKISRYIEGCVPFDYHDEAHVKAAMEIGRKLHRSQATSPWNFDVHEKAVDIVKLLDAVEFSDFDELALRAARLDAYVKADGVPRVLCHNDFYAPNFLVHGEGAAGAGAAGTAGAGANGSLASGPTLSDADLHALIEVDLIDWEYSAMSDYASDLGTFICCSDYSIEDAVHVIAEYFQREPTPAELRHCLAYVGLCAYYWFVWALYKEKTGDPTGEWLYLWYRAAKEFGAYAEQLYADAATTATAPAPSNSAENASASTSSAASATGEGASAWNS